MEICESFEESIAIAPILLYDVNELFCQTSLWTNQEGARKVRFMMTHFQKLLCGVLSAVFASLCIGGLSLHAAEGEKHNYVAIEQHEATCTSKGYTVYQCTEHNETYIEYTADEKPHTWEVLEKTEPTCTQSGSLTRRCKVCGTVENTVNGSAKGHSFSEPKIKAPTCSEEGYTYRECADCGEIEIDETSYTAKSDHTFEQHIITEPTCLQEGYAEFTCTVCGFSYRESVDKVDHDWEAKVTPPTHTEQGYTTYTCRFCELTKRENFTNPIPYDLKFTVLTEPTCTEDGTGIGICKDGCGYTEQQVLPKLGHDFGEAEGEESDENAGWVLVREPADSLDGLEQRVCLRCGFTESRAVPFIDPKEQPSSHLSTAALIGIGFAILLVLGIAVVLMLIILEHIGHKNARKHTLLTAVDRALEEQKKSEKQEEQGQSNIDQS